MKITFKAATPRGGTEANLSGLPETALGFRRGQGSLSSQVRVPEGTEFSS